MTTHSNANPKPVDGPPEFTTPDGEESHPKLGRLFGASLSWHETMKIMEDRMLGIGKDLQSTFDDFMFEPNEDSLQKLVEASGNFMTTTHAWKAEKEKLKAEVDIDVEHWNDEHPEEPQEGES